MDLMRKLSSVSLCQNTRERLASFGKKNQSYDHLVNEILDFIEHSDQWWAERR